MISPPPQVRLEELLQQSARRPVRNQSEPLAQNPGIQISQDVRDEYQPRQELDRPRDRVNRVNSLICKISSLSPTDNNTLSSLGLIAQPNQAIEISLQTML